MMFDAESARLIRAAPPLRGTDPILLPQELTRAYAELAALRLRGADVEDSKAYRQSLDRIFRIATIYEAAVDTGADGETRRAAAFVAGTAYQILGRAWRREEATGQALLSPAAIHPDVAAPLLFLIAEQSPDAREAGRVLKGARTDDLLSKALIETIYDLAAEQFEAVLERAERLSAARPTTNAALSVQAAQALYGLCWTGILHMVARLLDRPVPLTTFRSFDTPERAFDEVVRLASEHIELPGEGGQLISSYSGPRHLARLLREVTAGLAGSGVFSLPVPVSASANFWTRWLRHRAQSKPALWRNHRAAIATGFLEHGRSAVLVLPTGAGKTTLSELKIAAVLAIGKKVIFLVPTLALVDQLRGDLADSFPAELGEVAVSSDGDLANVVSGPELKSIEVMTPERFLALLSFADTDVSDIGLIVFDECHLLSPAGGGGRSLDAMLCLMHALKRAPQADLLLLSAMLNNADEVASWLAEVTERPCTAFHDPWKPSRQARGIVIYPEADLRAIDRVAQVRRRAARLGQRYRRPPLTASPHALFGLQSNWNPDAGQDIHLVKLTDEPVHLSVGSRGVTPNANKVAVRLAARAVAAKLKTIIFVQQADHAPATTRKLVGQVEGAERLTEVEEMLWSDIQTELGEGAASLVDTTAGALPHNGDMITLERRLAESLFRRADGVSVIVATPTLAQGMNLPAQIAILAGNKRHDDTGRAELQQHELLNAAGRAGRAGYLANGTVLLIPEPVVGFGANGRPSAAAIAKLQSILPDSDQCVRIDDPLTELLDRIQAGERAAPQVRYLLSRLRAGEEDADAEEVAVHMVRRSFAAYQARIRADEAAFAEKVAAVQAALTEDVDRSNLEITRIAALTGMPAEALEAASARFDQDLDGLPSTIVGWSDWLVDFFCEDVGAFEALLDRDVYVVSLVTRGKKTGGRPTPQDFEVLKAGLCAWLGGQPFCEIETALGVAPDAVGVCKRARDLALKLASRKLYMIAAAVAELAKIKLAAIGKVATNPAVLEILAIAFRRGFDTPEKAAFAYLHPELRTRTLVHRVYRQRLGEPEPVLGQQFQEILAHVQFRLALGNAGIGP